MYALCYLTISLSLAAPLPKEKEPDRFAKAYIGIQLNEIDKLIISKVYEGSPAEKAGLKEKDIIQKIDGERPLSISSARDLIQKQRPGNNLEIEIERDGKAMKITVKVGAKPED